jgi:hypothetical protein
MYFTKFNCKNPQGNCETTPVQYGTVLGRAVKYLVNDTMPMSRNFFVLFAVALLICYSTAQITVFTPEQFHIAMAGKTGMRINWFTNQTTVSSVCNFGVSSTTEYSATGSQETYLEGWGSHHSVLLENLKLATTYQYSCGDGSAEPSSNSETFQFTTAPDDDYRGPINLAVFGDMGYLDSEARPMGILGNLAMAGNWSATFSRETLESWKNNKEIDMVWHVGDVGYADDAVFHTAKTFVQFEYESANNGYMNWIQNVTSVIPYHVGPGRTIIQYLVSLLFIFLWCSLDEYIIFYFFFF